MRQLNNSKIKVLLLFLFVSINSCTIPNVNNDKSTKDNTPTLVQITDITLNGNIAKVSVIMTDKSGISNSSIINVADIEGIHLQNLLPSNTDNINLSVNIPDEIIQDFKDNSDGLKNIVKYSSLASVYKKITDSVNNINDCSYKENYLNLIKEIINQDELIISNKSNDISSESETIKPNDSKIIDLKNKIETRIVKLESLRSYLFTIAKNLKCYKDNENL